MLSLTRPPNSAKPTSLALSLSSTTLLVGLSTGQLHVYDVLTSQLLRTLDLAPETNAKPAVRGVSNLHVLLNPIAPVAAGGENKQAPPHTLEALARTTEKKREEKVLLAEGEWSDAVSLPLPSLPLSLSVF